MDVYERTKRDQLYRAIKNSREVLRPFRIKREEMVRSYEGSNWGDNDSSSDGQSTNRTEILANFLNMTADTYKMLLAANRPRVLISTFKQPYLPFAKRFQIAVDNLIQEIHLEETLKRIILDAFFSIGIAKVYTRSTGKKKPMLNLEYPFEEVGIQLSDQDEEGAVLEPGPYATADQWRRYNEVQRAIPQNIWMDVEEPFVEAISLDDWCHDTQATGWEKIRFAAHYYRVPWSHVKEDDRFDEDVVKMIEPSSKYGGLHTYDGETEVKDHARYNQGDFDELEPMVDLMDVWLPETGEWCIFPRDKNTPPLYCEEWDGPETGPYHILRFSDVPDNIMPSAPAQNLFAMSNLMNSLMRKQARQAKRQKTFFAFQGDGQDARQSQQAKDGEMVRVNNPDNVKAISNPGVDQGTYAFYQSVEGLFSRMAGNLEAMAGLGPQSGTYGQDKLIHSQVSSRIAKMQQEVVKFTEGICRDLGWMLWVDAAKTIPAQMEDPRLPIPADMTWTPENREGDFLDYNFRVEPYSMAYKSPSERANALMQILTQFYIPMSGQIQASGGEIDVEEITDMFSELLDMPRLKQAVKFMQDAMEEQQIVQQGQPPKPATSTRSYEHRSVPTQGSVQGQRHAQTMAAFGANNSRNFSGSGGGQAT